jgi:hypothetical protein
MMSLVNVSWLVACLFTILVTNINHLFLLVFIVWHDNELNLKACFSFIMELSCPFLCWELKNVSWVCISLQNQKLTKFFTIDTTCTNLKVHHEWYPTRKYPFKIWHYMTYDEHLQYHKNNIFWCKQNILV